MWGSEKKTKIGRQSVHTGRWVRDGEIERGRQRRREPSGVTKNIKKMCSGEGGIENVRIERERETNMEGERGRTLREKIE